ncbi:MAG: hypothetical protein AAGD05_05520 [Bacteroidota bacterium]
MASDGLLLALTNLLKPQLTERAEKRIRQELDFFQEDQKTPEVSLFRELTLNFKDKVISIGYKNKANALLGKEAARHWQNRRGCNCVASPILSITKSFKEDD